MSECNIETTDTPYFIRTIILLLGEINAKLEVQTRNEKKHDPILYEIYRIGCKVLDELNTSEPQAEYVYFKLISMVKLALKKEYSI